MWRGPDRATAITAIFVASALCGGASVEKVTQDYDDSASVEWLSHRSL
jgi:hypothetical protein